MRLSRPAGSPGDEATVLDLLLRSQRRVAVRLVGFSGLISILALTVSLYMMQVYDRVLASQSKDTLFFLTLATVLAIGLSAILDGVRLQVANRVGIWLTQELGPYLLERSLELRLLMPNMRLEALREVALLKNFISTPTVFNIVDMLWIPIYLVVIFLLHPMFGLVALVGAAALFGLALLYERSSRSLIRSAQTQASANLAFAESLIRNSEVIDAMGMGADAVRHWTRGHASELAASEASQGRSATILAVSKFVRYSVQIALLCVGALLVIDLEVTAGAMIAGSIIVARLLAPIEGSIGYWKQFVLARQSLEKLRRFCSLPQLRQSSMSLPKPRGRLVASNLTFVPPGLTTPVLRGVSFQVEPGELLAIVGPSASGKTTLSRLIVGVLKPSNGNVRLDRADTFEWNREDFGPNVGYLPQDIELLPGSIRDNIARFRADATDQQVVAAAQAAGCHDMILELTGGYELVLGEGGHQLSGGQRQRVGLARAMFGGPSLVVLDEPNSSLDTRGEDELRQTLLALRRNMVTTVIVAHRTNLLRMADKILVLQDGKVARFGPADEVINQYERSAGGRPPNAPRAPSPVADPVDTVQPMEAS